MERRFATVISWLLHPLLLPLYSFILLLFHPGLSAILIPLKTKLGILAFVFLLAAVLPSLITYLLLKRGLISSLHLEKRQDRLLPYLLTAGCFYLIAHMVNKLQLPAVFYLFGLGMTLVVIMALFMTFYVRVSVHLMGIGGMTGAFLAMAVRWDVGMQWTLVVLFLLSGLSAYARLRLQSHQPVEVISGYVTGFGLMLLLFLLI